jgi:raffinose/stachyose/melibiose transport system permease protein
MKAATARLQVQGLYFIKKIKRSLPGYTLIFPTFFLIIMFSYYPFLQAVIKSFYHWDGSTTTFAGMDNYKRMFTSDVELMLSVKNQVVITIISILKVITFPLIVARMMFSLASGLLTRSYRISLLLPMTVPWIVMAFVWKSMYGTQGVFNTILTQIGLEQFVQNWLGDPNIALASVLFIGFPWVGGIAFLIFLAGFQNIDKSLLESATLDGAGFWSRFWKVEIPLIQTQMRILLVLTVLDSLKSYGFLIFLTNGGPAYATLSPGVWIYQNSFMFLRFGYASAIGVIMLIVTALLSWLMIRLTRRGDLHV